MKDFLDLVMHVIRVDIFIGFGLYSILYVLITLFKKDIRLLETMDLNSARFITFAGIIYFLSIVFWTILSFATLPDSNTAPRQFWWVPWLQPLIWILITQLFWINKIKNIKVLRVVIAMVLIVSFEMFVIIVTSLHRDHVPETWSTESGTIFNWISPSELIFGLTTKIVLFCLLATLYVFIVDKLKSSAR
jgi:hypothetical protein